MFRSLGQAKQNQHVVIGLNSKLDALQARILSWKLPHLERWNEQRRQVAKHYREALAALPVTFQAVAGADDHVYHLFQLRSENAIACWSIWSKRGGRDRPLSDPDPSPTGV